MRDADRPEAAGGGLPGGDEAAARGPPLCLGVPAAAEDVEAAWLADEPVAAYREPLPARAGRWLRRHRTAAVAAVVLLVAATAGLAIDDVRVSRERAETAKALVLARTEGARAESERDRAEGERKAAVASRELAETSFAVARGALDQIRETVLGHQLTLSASEDNLRIALTQVALGFYERLLALAPNDRMVRASTALVAIQAGRLARMIGQFGDWPASATFRRSNWRRPSPLRRRTTRIPTSSTPRPSTPWATSTRRTVSRAWPSPGSARRWPRSAGRARDRRPSRTAAGPRRWPGSTWP